MNWAVLVALGAGILFSLQNIAVRHCATGTVRISTIAVVVTGVGVVTLGPMSVARLGTAAWLHTPWEHYAWMLTAGVCNMLAFFAIIRGLQLTTVVHVYLISAAQVALASAAGIAFFQETPNRCLLGGISLMIFGIVMLGQPAE